MTESPNTIEEIETMANAAVRYGKSICPGGTYGGRLVIAQIGRDFMSTQVRPVQEIAISRAARTSAIRDQSVQ